MSLRADSLRKIQQYVPAIRPIYLLTGSALFTCSLDLPYLPAHWIRPIYLLTGSTLFTCSLDPPYLPAHWIRPIYLLTGSARLPGTQYYVAHILT